MLSHDVNLPRDQEPEFPPRCVHCDRSDPDDQYGVKAAVITLPALLSFLLPLLSLMTKVERIEAPACTGCVSKMRRTYLLRQSISWILLILVFALGIYFDVGKPLLIGGVLLALVPEILLDVFSCQSFDVTVFKENIDYEFKDAVYAHEFADRNGGEVE